MSDERWANGVENPWFSPPMGDGQLSMVNGQKNAPRYLHGTGRIFRPCVDRVQRRYSSLSLIGERFAHIRATTITMSTISTMPTMPVGAWRAPIVRYTSARERTLRPPLPLPSPPHRRPIAAPIVGAPLVGAHHRIRRGTVATPTLTHALRQAPRAVALAACHS